MMPCHSGRETSHHHKSNKDSSGDKKKKKKKEVSPTRWSSSHKACKDGGHRLPPVPLFHQHSCIFSINCFIVKLVCLL